MGDVYVAQSAVPHVFMFPYLIADVLVRYLVYVAQVDIVSSY